MFQTICRVISAPVSPHVSQPDVVAERGESVAERLNVFDLKYIDTLV
jgi:hypothetical protein